LIDMVTRDEFKKKLQDLPGFITNHRVKLEIIKFGGTKDVEPEVERETLNVWTMKGTGKVKRQEIIIVVLNPYTDHEEVFEEV